MYKPTRRSFRVRLTELKMARVVAANKRQKKRLAIAREYHNIMETRWSA